MIRISILAIIFLILQNTELSSQAIDSLAKTKKKSNIFIILTGGYAQYNIKSVKDAFPQALSRLNFPAKITDNFPNLPYFQIEALLSTYHFDLGLGFSNLTTGGRIAYSDYSGSYTFDQVLTNNTIGLIVRMHTTRDKLVNIMLEAGGGLEFTNIMLDESMNIYDLKSSDSQSLGFTSFYLTPGVKALFNSGYLVCGAGINYHFEFGSDLTIAWSGIRLGIFAGVKF